MQCVGWDLVECGTGFRRITLNAGAIPVEKATPSGSLLGHNKLLSVAINLFPGIPLTNSDLPTEHSIYSYLWPQRLRGSICLEVLF